MDAAASEISVFDMHGYKRAAEEEHDIRALCRCLSHVSQMMAHRDGGVLKHDRLRLASTKTASGVDPGGSSPIRNMHTAIPNG